MKKGNSRLKKESPHAATCLSTSAMPVKLNIYAITLNQFISSIGEISNTPIIFLVWVKIIKGTVKVFPSRDVRQIPKDYKETTAKKQGWW